MPGSERPLSAQAQANQKLRGGDPNRACSQPGHVWRPAGACRPAAAGLPGGPKPDRSPHAIGEAIRQEQAEEVSPDYQQPA